MIKLNDDSIYVGQIKQILHSFNLPMFSIYQEGNKYALGEHYLKDGTIYGHVNIYDENGKFVKEDLEKIIKFYTFGESIENLTTKFPISSNLYDSKTHIYLGNYLRFLRDYMGLDLMSLYNCCGYDSPRDLNAFYNLGDRKIIFSSYDQEYTIIMIPVKWGQKYTIGIDYHGDIEMACMHFEDNIMLDYNSNSGYSMLDKTYFKVRGARFNHPFIYDKLSLDEVNLRKISGDAKESTLKLFIKVPSSCTSSIVVLEGDYVNCSNENMYMDDYTQKLGNNPFLSGIDPITGKEAKYTFMMNYEYVNKNQLLSLNMGQKVLLADRLVEYLSQQAIAPNDDVVDNIKRTQRTLNRNNLIGDYYIKEYGVWDESMRQAIYKFIWSSGIINNYQDMLSYFDKDVETKIGGLLTKYNEINPKYKVFNHEETGGR